MKSKITKIIVLLLSFSMILGTCFTINAEELSIDIEDTIQETIEDEIFQEIIILDEFPEDFNLDQTNQVIDEDFELEEIVEDEFIEEELVVEELAEEVILIDQPEVHTHALTKTEAKEATEEAEGNSEYWTCSSCGKYFSDENGENEIEENSWVIPKIKKAKIVPITAQAAPVDEESLGNGTEGIYAHKSGATDIYTMFKVYTSSAIKVDGTIYATIYVSAPASGVFIYISGYKG